MTLDSSGNLLVGTTSTGFSAEGHVFRAGDFASHTVDNSPVMLLNRTTSDGSIFQFRKDGAMVGNIGVVSASNFFIGSEASGVTFRRGVPDIVSSENGQNRNGTTNLGAAVARWKDLYLSGGVYLGGTGSANLLDDYETGTWTPTTNGDATGAFSAQSGRYVKVGDLVHCYCVFDVSTNFSSGNVGGLPFIPDTNSAISGVYCGGVAATSTTTQTFVVQDNQLIKFSSSTNPNTTNNIYRLAFSFRSR